MVKHVMKDGTVRKSIDGYTVTRKQAPVVYEILNRIEREKRHEQSRTRQDIQKKRTD